jgi:hypothetical protein
MSSRATAKIERVLLKKGFVRSDTHHKYLELAVNGKRRGIRTFLSHGIDEYGDGLLSAVAKELHLTKAELLRLIDCLMSGEEYIQTLVEAGHMGL